MWIQMVDFDFTKTREKIVRIQQVNYINGENKGNRMNNGILNWCRRKDFVKSGKKSDEIANWLWRFKNENDKIYEFLHIFAQKSFFTLTYARYNLDSGTL